MSYHYGTHSWSNRAYLGLSGHQDNPRSRPVHPGINNQDEFRWTDGESAMHNAVSQWEGTHTNETEIRRVDVLWLAD